MNYFLLPGNPPAVHFYEHWGKEIKASYPEAKVKVSHYPDLVYTDNSKEAMVEVLEAHLEQLEVFYNDSQAPITLIGHSLGGHFALGLLSKVPNWIDKVILLHPFIRRPTPLGLLVLNAAGSFCGSNTFQRSFFGIRKGLELFVADLAYVTNEEATRSLHLARHESRTISRDCSKVEIEFNLRSKIEVFYNKNDIWCTSKVIEELSQQVSVEQCDEPHGFVTSDKYRMRLFAKILGRT